ncbi:MAG TPA: SsrA-binding protein SmpB [Terriglobales bacterium]|nr:SsrA-binding protein SmpB [Terriglobales bacterium]
MARQTTHQVAPNKEKNPKRDPVASGERDATQNRAASHNYFLSDKAEAGIVLRGTEVKAIREGKANLKDAYATVKDGELFLLNLHIGSYAPGGTYYQHDPTRTRKLLMKKPEILKLGSKLQTKGVTLIPTRMYFKNGKVKVEVAVAKGKQLWDKRETEKRKSADREAREAIARSRKS